MILRQYQSLGILPEIIVFAFLAASVMTLGYSVFKVSYRDPVIVVPNAIGAGPLLPASANDAYLTSFATNFLANWSTWNEYTYQYRRSIAISMMTPSVRAQFQAMAAQASGLMNSLSQSQSFDLQGLTLKRLDATFAQVTYSGNVRTYYGGVGGEAEPFNGALLLRAVTPSPQNPLCLEVFGFLHDRQQDHRQP
ncbi:MAG TPA: TraE/TraK family type IV conjugative transfer system protein [Planctomycetota bacterium]|nr:TraE/TraK family type IV conjugative transfer system protein [Planctomycetota bacterium]